MREAAEPPTNGALGVTCGVDGLLRARRQSLGMQYALPMSLQRRVRISRVRGFTLIEVMITVAIVAILAGIGYPAYSDYVLRGRLVDATNTLSATSARMEQYFQDNRTYAAVGTFTPPCSTTQTVGAFSVSCTGTGSVLSATQYTIVARGSGTTNGFVFTVDQNGTRMTTGVKSGWGTPPYTCWLTKKGSC